mgnify:CR=1 FL=1
MLLLAEGGVPWDVACKWSSTRRFAACVIIMERKSRETYGLAPMSFDWDVGSYVEVDGGP